MRLGDHRGDQVARGAAVLLAAWVAWSMGPYAGGSDSAGYLSAARLIAQGKVAQDIRALPGFSPVEFGPDAFVPLGFTVVADTTQMQARYPMGLPLHLVALAWLTGWPVAARIVNALAAGAVLLLTRRVCLAAGATEWSAAGATLAVVASPVFVFAALQPMSDLLATAWALAALVCAWRGRERAGWALAAGAAVGVATLVRPTNVLVLIPVACALAPRWQRLGAVIAGGLPAAAFLVVFNRVAYGDALATGYGGDVSTAFGLAFLRSNVVPMITWVPVLLTPLAAFAVLAPVRPMGRTRLHVVLWAWIAALGLCYGLYFHTGESWWYQRFLLPFYPTLAALAATALAVPLRSARHRVVAIALLAAVAAWQWRNTQRFDVLALPAGEQKYQRAAEWAGRHLPPNAIVVCMQVSGALHYYTDLIVARWDHPYRHRLPRLVTAARAQERPIYAALHAFEESQARTLLPGQWIKVAESGPTTFWEIRDSP